MNKGLVALASATALIAGASAWYGVDRGFAERQVTTILSTVRNNLPARAAERQRQPSINILDPHRYTEPYSPSSVEREVIWLGISTVQASLDREPVFRNDSRWLFRQDPETGYIAVCANTIHTIFGPAQWPVTSYAAVIFDKSFKDTRNVVLGTGDQALEEMNAFCGPMGWRRP